MISLLNKLIFLYIFRWKIIGDIPSDNKIVFAVGPHTSAYDFFVGLFFRSKLNMENQIKFIGKEELFKIPFFGQFLRGLGGIPVVRNKNNNSVDYLVNVINNTDKIFLSLFPEGTSSDGLRVLKFRSGFFQLAFNNIGEKKLNVINIQPLSIFYEPKNSDMSIDFYGWWGNMSLFLNILKVLCKSSGIISLNFHMLLKSDSFQNRKQLASKAEDIIRHELNFNIEKRKH